MILNLGNILTTGFEQILLQEPAVGAPAGQVLDTFVYFQGILGGNWGLAAAVGLFKGVFGTILVISANKARPHAGRTGGVLMAVARRLALLEGTPERRCPSAQGGGLIVLVVVMLFPFVYVLSVSLSSERDLRVPTLHSFHCIRHSRRIRTILQGGVVTSALEVSVGVTVVGTLVCMLMTTTLAYGLSRTSRVPGTRFVLFLVLGTLLFNAGIIPNYLLVRYLGLLNSYTAIIVPGLISAFNLVVVRQFFMSIPDDLTDAAMMDGANPLQIFWHIILPLSKAVLAVVALFYGVAFWSDYFNPLLYLNDVAMWPIPLVLRLYVLQGQSLTGAQQVGQPLPPAATIQMAVVVIATVPILIVYPFLQRYFTQGAFGRRQGLMRRLL